MDQARSSGEWLLAPIFCEGHYFYARREGASSRGSKWWDHWILPCFLTMAHLPAYVVDQRRALLQEEIVDSWQDVSGKTMYVIVCPCELPSCAHMPEARFPRLRISKCFYPGELDFLMVHKPFLQEYGFEVTWICRRSSHGCEFSCGSPSDHGGIIPPDAGW